MKKGTGQLLTNPTCRSFREENTEIQYNLVENLCQLINQSFSQESLSFTKLIELLNSYELHVKY